MEYFFSCKNGATTGKNDWINNVKEKKEIKCKEMAFWRGSNKFVSFEKICESTIYEDNLIEFSWFYTSYFTRNWILIGKIIVLRL